MDCDGWLSGVSSPEFYPYDPCTWGMLGNEQRERIRAALATVEKVCQKSNREQYKANLQWLADNLRFFLQLEEVGRKMQPALGLRNRRLNGQVGGDALQTELAAARKVLDEVPLRELFETYARRVRSRGELGILSSLNQRLWLQYRELNRFLDDVTALEASDNTNHNKFLRST
jgi:hypothetical protein